MSTKPDKSNDSRMNPAISRYLVSEDRGLSRFPVDSETVQSLISDAAWYLNQRLPEKMRTHIHEKWGLTDETIDSHGIGFMSDGDALLSYLRSEGYDDTAIAMSGLASCGSLNHIYECSFPKLLAKKAENGDEEAAQRLEAYKADRGLAADQHISPCSHDVPETLDDLALQRADPDSDISIADISFDAVYRTLDAADSWTLNIWWEERITIPYYDEDGNIVYIAGRRTEGTRDKVYNDGITRRSDNRAFGQDDEWVVLQDADAPADSSPDSLIEPAAVEVTQDTPVVFDLDDTNIAFLKTPDDADIQAESGTVDGKPVLIPEAYGTYHFECQSTGARGAIICSKYQYNDGSHEAFLEDTPNFQVDIAKYLKQTKSKPWIADCVEEPLLGCHTVTEGSNLLITEGLTDCLAAIQAGIPAVTPATTNISAELAPTLAEYCDTAETAYIVNDNDKNHSGIDGALKTALTLEEHDAEVRVGLPPRPESVDSIDLAEFLKDKANPRSALISEILNPDATYEPRSHPLYDDEAHAPIHKIEGEADIEDHERAVKTRGTSVDYDFGAFEVPFGERRSELFELTLDDVVSPERVRTLIRQNTRVSPPTISSLTRGRMVNPFGHWSESGGSQNYFSFRRYRRETQSGDTETKLVAKCFKSGQSYPLPVWLALEAGVAETAGSRSNISPHRNPKTSLSREDVYEIWKHAVQADHIPLGEDDPVPTPALWFLIERADLLPDEAIPDDPASGRLPPESIVEKVESWVRESDL